MTEPREHDVVLRVDAEVAPEPLGSQGIVRMFDYEESPAPSSMQEMLADFRFGITLEPGESEDPSVLTNAEMSIIERDQTDKLNKQLS